MREDRKRHAVVALVLLVIGVALLLWSWTAASKAVNSAFNSYNAALIKKNLTPLSVLDIVRAHHTETGQLYPRMKGVSPPCGSDCIALYVVKARQMLLTPFGIVTVPLVAGAGVTLVLLGILCGAVAGRPNPRRNLINYQRGRIRLRSQSNVLPIVQVGRTRLGLMRRDDLRGGGRREFGNAMFVGKPGSGKSSLLKSWLLTADALNFVVIDLKGDLWKTTAAHRADLGAVIRLDLTSFEGHALDPLDTDDRGTAQAVIDTFLPSDPGNKSQYFNAQAAGIALAYWSAARLTRQSPMSVLVRTATSPVPDMLELARGLIALAPVHRRAELLRNFRSVFGAVWDDIDAAAGGERGSVIQSFKAGFAGLATPTILTTLCRTTFDFTELVERRTTVYITAPSTSAPYKAPLEVLIGAIVEAIKRHVDHERAGVQGEDIVILADEAGILHIPEFVDTLAGGRSRGITVAAFVQSMGQLDQYHSRGWKGIVDTVHHWVWWNTNDPDAHRFLNERCGNFDKVNPSRNREERQRRPYVEMSAFGEFSSRWKETQVFALLDYDRTYPICGPAVTVYQHTKLKREMQRPAPELPDLYDVPKVQVAQIRDVITLTA